MSASSNYAFTNATSTILPMAFYRRVHQQMIRGLHLQCRGLAGLTSSLPKTGSKLQEVSGELWRTWPGSKMLETAGPHVGETWRWQLRIETYCLN